MSTKNKTLSVEKGCYTTTPIIFCKSSLQLHNFNPQKESLWLVTKVTLTRKQSQLKEIEKNHVISNFEAMFQRSPLISKTNASLNFLTFVFDNDRVHFVQHFHRSSMENDLSNISHFHSFQTNVKKNKSLIYFSICNRQCQD